MVDEHGLAAFGVRLVAGRGFTSDEIRQLRSTDTYVPSVVIVTRALAQSLFPSGDALGKNIYLLSSKAPSRIVGLVERCQTPLAATSWGEQFVENSSFLPVQLVQNKLSYVVRTRSGQRDAVMQIAPGKLLQLSHARIIDNLEPFSQTRARAYHGDHALSLILGTLCTLLLAVTALGIVGLTSYWVAQRRSQIGIRRALGARKNQDRRRERLLEEGLSEEEIDRIAGPVGLDIGATTPEGIALSIIGQIHAWLAGRAYSEAVLTKEPG